MLSLRSGALKTLLRSVVIVKGTQNWFVSAAESFRLRSENAIQRSNVPIGDFVSTD